MGFARVRDVIGDRAGDWNLFSLGMAEGGDGGAAAAADGGAVDFCSAGADSVRGGKIFGESGAAGGAAVVAAGGEFPDFWRLYFDGDCDLPGVGFWRADAGGFLAGAG